ncbi:MAG: hypothetical protein QM519_07130 [Bacteroidia bacterium]|nr:hypothetical protein [Bacteroidia bacterium]
MIDLRHAIPTDLLRSPRVIASAVAVTVLAIVGVTALSDLGGSLLAPGVDPERADRVSPEFTRHEQMALIHRKRFEGRSLFTTPLKPPSRPKPAPVVRTEPPKPVAPPKPAGPPATYGGPRPTGVIADMLVLAGGRTVKVGESGDGITVVAILPPDEVRLKWSGGEYTVSLREKFDTSVLSSGSSSSMGRTNPPGITPVAADPNAAPATAPAPAPSTPGSTPAPAVPAPGEAPASTDLAPAVPAALDASAIEAMDREQASKALEEVSRALRGRSGDPAVKERLERERQLLIDRVNKLD